MKHIIFPLLLWTLSLLPASTVAARGPEREKEAVGEKWHGRSIYFIVTDRFAQERQQEVPCSGRLWCGGTFNGIVNNLDYIQGMGFDAIWITPPVKQVPWMDLYNGTGYHGYWAANFSEIDPHLGTAEELKNLSRELHARGMLLMCDVVANHVGPLFKESQLGDFFPFNKPEYYHTLGIETGESFEQYIEKPCDPFKDGCFMGNYSCPGYNQTVKEQCWFPTPLGDLRQENGEVAGMLHTWISDLVSSYNVDGLRLDTADFIPLPFLKTFRKAASVPILGEVTTYNVSYAMSYAQALSSVLNFPVFFHLKTAFAGPGSQSLPASFVPLAEARREQLKLWRQSPIPIDINVLGNFVDNHDGPRFLREIAENDTAILRNSLAWALFSPGLPIVYYGTEQSFNQQDNRYSLWPKYDTESEMYTWLRFANKLRRDLDIASDPSAEDILVADSETLAFARGKSLIVATNNRVSSYKQKGAPLWCVSGVGLWASRLEKGCKLVDALGSWRAKNASDSCSSTVRIELETSVNLCMHAFLDANQQRAEECAREPVVAVCEKREA